MAVTASRDCDSQGVPRCLACQPCCEALGEKRHHHHDDERHEDGGCYTCTNRKWRFSNDWIDHQEENGQEREDRRPHEERQTNPVRRTWRRRRLSWGGFGRWGLSTHKETNSRLEHPIPLVPKFSELCFSGELGCVVARISGIHEQGKAESAVTAAGTWRRNRLTRQSAARCRSTRSRSTGWS